MSEEENVDDGVNELNEEFGIKDAEKDIIEVPSEESKDTEAELAQKALDESSESAESAETEEEKVPLAKMMGWKNKAKELEIENARLTGRDEVRSEISVSNTTTVAAKSPKQLLMEEQGVDSVDDLELTGAEAYKLARAEQAFETKQADNKTAETSAKTVKQAHEDSCKAAGETFADEGLEFVTIINEGKDLLTEGENLDLSKAGEDFGPEAYNKCLAAIIRKGGDRAKEIQKLIDAKNSKQLSDEDTEVAKKKAEEETAKAKAKDGKFDLEKSLNSDTDTGSEVEVKPSRRLAQFMVTADT